MTARIRQSDMDENPPAAWNAFVHFLATTPPDQLDDTQRAAKLVFEYESEVQNGGHPQYFLNQGEKQGEATEAALRALGGQAAAAILQRAVARWDSRQQTTPFEADEMITEALREGFQDLDEAFYRLDPNLVALLENNLDADFDAFVTIEP